MKVKKVLLVDDDEIVNFLNKVIIESHEFASEIVAETYGGNAIDYLKAELDHGTVPDIIFLDLNMPDMDGWSFIEEFKKIDFKGKSLKIFLLSSSIDPMDKERADAIPMICAFYSKPLSPKMLEQIQHS